MNNEPREREPDRWPGDESGTEVLEDGDIADDPSFVKAAPIDIRGAWRKALSLQLLVGGRAPYDAPLPERA